MIESCRRSRPPTRSIALALLCLTALYVILVKDLIDPKDNKCASVDGTDPNEGGNGTVSGGLIDSNDRSTDIKIEAERRLNYTRRAINDRMWRPADVLLIAHRGCQGRFPENSLAAIAACCEEGGHIVEIDLAMTSDNQLVLLHDTSPQRTTNRAQWTDSRIPVANLTLKQLQSDYWLVQNEYTAALTNFRVPTFKEAVEVAKTCGIHLFIDRKSSKEKSTNFLSQIASVLSETKAFDIVLLDKQNNDPTNVTEKLRFVVETNSSADAKQQAPPAAWKPKDPLRRVPQGLCELCKQNGRPGCIFSVLWKSGEYYLRDPKKLHRYYLNASFEGETPTVAPCPNETNLEKSCIGAHFYQPLTKNTCARMIFTDLPGTARSALLGSGQMAPPDIYPLADIRTAEDGKFHRVPEIPACLEEYYRSKSLS